MTGPGVEEEPEIYEQAVLDKFFAACTVGERLIYEFFLMSGFRKQEVIYATDRCIDFENGTIAVRHNPEFGWTPKMYKERTVPVPQILINRSTGYNACWLNRATVGYCSRPAKGSHSTIFWRWRRRLPVAQNFLKRRSGSIGSGDILYSGALVWG
jgi:integrase